MERVHVENQITRLDILIGVAGGVVLGGSVGFVGFLSSLHRSARTQKSAMPRGFQ